MFAIPRALHIAGEAHGDYLRHVRATSSFRTAGSLELEDRDSVQMNRKSKKATSYCIQTFGQPSNMNPRRAYTTLHLYAYDTLNATATFAQCILHVMQLLISHLSFCLTSITASQIPASPSRQHGRANQLSLKNQHQRESCSDSLLIDGPRC